MIKIHDQAKDIGVMLSLGMRASLIRRAFFEESVVVIFTAGLVRNFKTYMKYTLVNRPTFSWVL